MRKNREFVAMLFVGALACLIAGAIPLYWQAQYYWLSESGLMFSSDPAIQKAVKYNQVSFMRATVRYESQNGPRTVTNKHIREEHVERLAAGEGIPVKYVKNDPHKVWYENERPASPVAWLLVSGLLFVTAFYALDLYKREVQA